MSSIDAGETGKGQAKVCGERFCADLASDANSNSNPNSSDPTLIGNETMVIKELADTGKIQCA